MTSTTTVVVGIIGAGPAGLTLGRELARRGISYAIWEKDEVGWTFASMTESTTFGPWLNNMLPGSPVPWTKLLSRTTRPEYAAYLKEYARRHAIAVRPGVRVTEVGKLDSGFLVRSATGGSLACRFLVNATGIFGKPFRPEYPGKSTIPSLHSSGYRSPETVRQLCGRHDPKVLIVGSGLSAGEILQELHGAGCQVHLSHRGRIDTWPSPLAETLLSPLTYIWEEISLRLGLPKPGNLRPRLRQGAQLDLLRRGQVRTHPDIACFEGSCVRFTDNAVDSYDLVLYATGYRPALDHLAPLLRDPLPRVQNLEVAEIPDLFLLGFPGGRTFRSEFLRGLREDAVHLAGLLQERIASGPPRRDKEGPPPRRDREGPPPLRAFAQDSEDRLEQVEQ